MVQVQEYVWVFQRESQRLEIRRACADDDGVLLSLTMNGALQSYDFRNLSALLLFQGEVEALLLRTGWTFQEFQPERRSGADRRIRPSRRERRRWWTD